MATASEPEPGPVTGVEELLDRIEAAAEGDRVSLEEVMSALGQRSFAPLLLVAGLVILVPVVGDIPGVPVLMGTVVVLVAGQILLRRRHLWLPAWLLRRDVATDTMCKALRWLRRPARFVDRWTRPRLCPLVRHASVHVIAATCILIAAATPVMEFVPFSANIAGVAITAFALALTAQDGLLALVAIAFSLGTVALLIVQLL